jgi:hypothetical protein
VVNKTMMRIDLPKKLKKAKLLNLKSIGIIIFQIE